MTDQYVDHADRARLAHTALRLRESGLDSDTKLAKAAAAYQNYAENAPEPMANQIAEAVRAGDMEKATELAATSVVTPGSSVVALGALADKMLSVRNSDAPGLTAPDLVEHLMSSSLDDIWKQWDEAVTANLEATLSAKDLKHWRASVERDQKSAEESMAKMQETGNWPVHPYFGHNRHLDGAANALYDLGREGILNAEISVSVAAVKWVLVDSADYTVNLATHKFLSSVAGAGRVATSAALTTKTYAAGVFDADDPTLSSVSGDVSEALILYQSSAVTGGADVADTSQRLIGYVDTATGLPVTPNGGNINIVHDSGSNRIFKL